MPLLPPEEASEKLLGYPDEILGAYTDFFEQKNPDSLDTVVFGVIAFLMPEPPEQPLGSLPESTHLRNDLEVDSITIAEVVFVIEDLFDISISNEALAGIETLGNLRQYLHQQLFS